MTSSSADEPDLSDRLADLLFFAPLGLLWERDQVFDRLVKRGRSQSQLAKLAAQMAAQRAPEQVEAQITKALEGLARAAAGPLTRVLIETGVAFGVPGASRTTAPSKPQGEASPAASEVRPEPDLGGIDGYESLTAREILPLLATLDQAGLAALREREVAGRGRKTILTRIDQLLNPP